MRIKRFLTGPVPTITYIVSIGEQAAVIDPAGFTDKMKAYLEKNELNICLVLITHGHIDHFYAAAEICKEYGLPAYVSRADKDMLYDNEHNAANMLNITDSVVPENLILLDDGDTIPFAGGEFKFILTPGHTQGSGAYLYEDELFCGDTLFKHSVGRTDLYGASQAALEKSIRTRLYTLPDETKVWSGHSDLTTIREEKANNPYIKG